MIPDPFDTVANVRPGVKGFVPIPLPVRFWAKVEKRGNDECWPWLGSTRSSNPRRAYGIIWAGGRNRPAHQVAWELHHGREFPEGMHGCHHCDNPPCVNPTHIFVGTRSDNMRDARSKGVQLGHVPWTHCKRGHEFTPENTYIDNRDGRSCWQCRVDRERKRWKTHRT